MSSANCGQILNGMQTLTGISRYNLKLQSARGRIKTLQEFTLRFCYNKLLRFYFLKYRDCNSFARGVLKNQRAFPCYIVATASGIKSLTLKWFEAFLSYHSFKLQM